MRRRMPLINAPVVRRLAWYGRQLREQLNPRMVVNVLVALLFVVAIVALIEMLAERQLSLADYAESLFWALTSLMGNGDPSFATGPIGGILYVVLIAIGLIMIGLVTGAIIAVIIDFLLKEGQGLGASGFRNHIVICGWNPTAREAIDELRSDTYKRKLVSSTTPSATRRKSSSTTSAATRPTGTTWRAPTSTTRRRHSSSPRTRPTKRI